MEFGNNELRGRYICILSLQYLVAMFIRKLLRVISRLAHYVKATRAAVMSDQLLDHFNRSANL